jgi:hypothetical protein
MAVVYLLSLVKRGKEKERDFSAEKFGLGVRAFEMC